MNGFAMCHLRWTRGWKKFPSWLAVAVLLAGVFSLPLQADEPANPRSWDKVVVIGASASAGFVLAEPFGGSQTTQCKLRYYLEAAIAAPHAPIRDFSTALMFMNPVDFSQQQIDSARAAQPTLLIGVDFLFWSCYGDGLSAAGRLRRFDNSLKLLEQFHCPLVVGDIPDVSSATNTGIISAEQVPNATVLAQVNQRLHAWAADHPQVTVVPLAKFIRDISADKKVVIHGLVFPAGKTRALMQDDHLHPTPPGADVLALGILDALVSHDPKFAARDVRWDPKKVYQLGLQAAQKTLKD